MNRTPDDINRWYELIAKDLAGELSSAEKLELNQWRQEKPEHESMNASLHDLWKVPEEAVTFDEDAAWMKVRPKERPMFGIGMRWIGMAAGLLLLLGLGWWLKQWQLPEMQRMEGVAAHIPLWLPDSSQVWLDKGAVLEFEKNFAHGRHLRLSGKAYFEVKKNTTQPEFSVKTQDIQVQVLGTGFTVNTLDSACTSVEVAHGKVRVQSEEKKEVSVILEKGEKAEFRAGQLKKSKIESANFRAWQTQSLLFEDQDLAHILPELESYFQVNIEVERPELLSCRFTAHFEKPALAETLQILCISTGLQFTESNGTFILSGKGCSSNP
ncbi:MAG: FecR domain-containing protein [Cytophagaceae bacterium]|jgi:ferric-dicitrate binding protein FerR (iron transport regulator)|nr:FecR domain-containing protein [Cytophagaceae bacterium]